MLFYVLRKLSFPYQEITKKNCNVYTEQTCHRHPRHAWELIIIPQTYMVINNHTPLQGGLLGVLKKLLV